MASPTVQKVPKLLLQLNEWQAQGKIDKQQGNALNAQVLSYNESVLALADEIGTTPDADLLAKALALLNAPAASSAASASRKGSSAVRRGGARPALNIGAVKDANATPEAAQADEQESQADALLKAKRLRNLKRQSMPEKQLPADVQSQVEQ